MSDDLWAQDKLKTEYNRKRLRNNKNLLFWYRQLYGLQFSGIRDVERKVILEIGSGTSPLKLYYPNILTSDCLDLDYLDYMLDFCRIDECRQIRKESLDIITMTNVLHHLKTPVLALIKAHEKLKKGGLIIMAEPYYSAISYIIFKLLHKEPSDFSARNPVLEEVRGPLSSANMAIPYRMFFKEKGWADMLRPYYDFTAGEALYYSGFSYMATGGIAHNFRIPWFLYQRFFELDRILAYKLPKIACSFFVMRLTKI